METSSPVARCQSCGGPSPDGELCMSCRQAFAPVLGNTTVTAPSADSAEVVAQKVPADDKPKVATPPASVNVNAIQTEVSRLETAKAVADLTAKAHLAKGANPAPVISRPIVPAPAPPSPQRRSRTTVLIKAAAVIVVAIGAAEGARRFGFNWFQQAARDGQPVQATPVAEAATAAEPRATPPDIRSPVSVAAENRAPEIAPSKTALSSKPKPPAAAGNRRTARQEKSSDQQVAPVAVPASAPVPETPAPVEPKPPAQVAEAPAAPVGRFFERNDVDEPPQIATRVEPQLPANLPARPSNDVVVVRVLVSRTGHPFRITLLRGSRLGRSSDEAVVAAVTRWTFSPAKKQGEPVNCWYNIGVPLGQAN